MDKLRRAVVATSPRAGGGALFMSLLVLALWAGLVGFGVHYHVFWRDEVRALSLALEAPDIFGVPAATQGDAHPALWHLLLRAAHDLFGTMHILSVVSVTVAAIAITLLIWEGPFPLWTKVPFIFTSLSIYEYAVMSRNYGISMLLIFLVSYLIAKPRRNYWMLGLALFLLGQTNVTSTMLTPLYLLFLYTHRGSSQRRDRIGLLICTVSVALGIIAAFLSVYPTRNDMIPGFYHRPDSVSSAIVAALLEPGREFIHLTPYVRGEAGAWLMTVLLYASTLGLLPDLVLVACATLAIWQTAWFYSFVYGGNGSRHEGLWIVFMISLYWIRHSSGRPLLEWAGRASWLRAASLVAFAVMISMNVPFAFDQLAKFYHQDQSMSRALGQLINADPVLRAAILLPEPEQVGEALPYYVDNDMYLAREHRFGKAAIWTRTSQQDLSLHDLLLIAQNLKQSTGKPVLILTQPHLTGEGGEFGGTFSWRFTYTPAEFAELNALTTKLPLARDAAVENVDAYLLR